MTEPSQHEEGVGRCLQLIERALKTLRVQPPVGHKPVRGSWPESVPDPHTGYGYSDARPPRFKPSPRDVENLLDVLGWITWLENQRGGRREAQIIVALAFGTPKWKLSQRFQRSERTIERWHSGGISRIYQEFMAEVRRMAA